jgi:TonB family protein
MLLATFALLVAQVSPSPAPLPTGPCSHDAAIVTPVMPDLPASFHPAGPLTVEAIVLLEADGSVGSATIARSSGYSAVDDAVIKAARASKYSPRVVACKAVEGRYLFRTDVRPGSP